MNNLISEYEKLDIASKTLFVQSIFGLSTLQKMEKNSPIGPILQALALSSESHSHIDGLLNASPIPNFQIPTRKEKNPKACSKAD